MKDKKENKGNIKAEFAALFNKLEEQLNNQLKSDDVPANIIDFCLREDLLNVKGQGFELWPWQSIILKCFYRGSMFNEDIELTDEEIQLMKDNDQHAALEKYDNGEPLTELVLALGRRSSKTFIISIITAYEIYKLREVNNGDPHGHFGIPRDKEISVINCATSKEQAQSPLFEEIKARFRNSPYFQMPGVMGSSTEDTLYVYTRKDRERQLQLAEEGNPISLKGSIVLRCGHSNSNSLRGKLAIVIIFDELAHFISKTSGKSSGAQVYESLVPSVGTFKQHGRILSLSNPAGKDGIFYKLYLQGLDRNSKNTLCFKLPTWISNPLMDKEHPLIASAYKRNPIMADMEWGANFSGSSSSNFLSNEEVEEIISYSLSQQEVGIPGRTYHMHVDPALTGDIYGCVIVHREDYQNDAGEKRKVCVVDHIRRWAPENNKPLDLDAIDNELIILARRFNVATMTFDNFQSAHSRQRWISNGINAFETRFGNAYKQQIYGVLRESAKLKNLVIPNDYFLVGELKSLKMKFESRGWTVNPDPNSDTPNDDLSDCLAGAMFVAFNYNTGKNKKLPKSLTVFTGRGGFKNGMV